MMRSIALVAVALFAATPIAAQNAALPMEVRLDLVTTRLDRSLRAGQFTGVLEALDELDAMGMPTTETALFLRAHALIQSREQTGTEARDGVGDVIEDYYRNFGAAGAYAQSLARTVLESAPEYAGSLPSSMALGSLADRLGNAIARDSMGAVVETLGSMRAAGVQPTDESLEVESWAHFSIGNVASAQRVANEYLRVVGRSGNNYESILDRFIFIQDLEVFSTDFASDRPLAEEKSGNCRGHYEDAVFVVEPTVGRWCSKRIPADVEPGNFNIGAVAEFAGEDVGSGSMFVDFGAHEGEHGWAFWRLEIRTDGYHRVARFDPRDDSWSALVDWRRLPQFSRLDPNFIELTVDQLTLRYSVNGSQLGTLALDAPPEGSVWIGGQDDVEVAWHSLSIFRVR